LLEGRELGTEHSAAEMAAAGAPVGDDQWVPRTGSLATDLVEGCHVELFGMSVTEVNRSFSATSPRMCVRSAGDRRCIGTSEEASAYWSVYEWRRSAWLPDRCD